MDEDYINRTLCLKKRKIPSSARDQEYSIPGNAL
jgi:hypothetical protein